ncbi:MAG: hypothetical protein V1701_02865 [Planctomycetota bacterium]
MDAKKLIRHGDMCLEEIDRLPEGLEKSGSEILMTGSGGNHHTYQNGEFYPKQVDAFVFGYFKSGEGCKLYHEGHGDKKPDGSFLIEKVNGRELMATIIPANKIFALRKQQEDTHEGMRPVAD